MLNEKSLDVIDRKQGKARKVVNVLWDC